MKNRWKSIYTQQRSLQRKVKNLEGAAEFFGDLPEEGYMRDNISKNKIAIADCKDSTLRRYTKLLTKYFSLCTKPQERKIVNDKLIEIQVELAKRGNLDE